MAHVLVIGALPESLTNFRGDLIRAMVAANHRVTAMAAPADDKQVKAVQSLGAEFCSFPVQRTGLNPLRDMQTLLALLKAIHRLAPDVILAYTIKPVIWGGLAAFFSKQAKFFALIEGLGYAFQGGSRKRRLAGTIATLLYRVCMIRAERVIFLNPDNKRYFEQNNIVKKSKTDMIDGIGLDLTWYAYRPIPESRSPVFLVIARLLGEKGLREYAHAARLVKQRYPDAVFRLLGPADPSPDGIPLEEVRQWQEQGLVDYLGETRDVRPFLADCHIYVLPSYHEGMPRTVLEAMATGRLILTTDVPGCRETVVPGENGYLVTKANAESLAERMIWIIEHRDEWESMGQAGRRMAEKRFDARRINAEMLQIMNLSSGACSP